MTVGPGDESEQLAGSEPQWQEAHRVDALLPSIGGAVSLMVAKHPAEKRASFVGALLRADRDPVVVAEIDIALPAERWEIRASGLWADHVCETALEHWSYGLEAFALEIEDPSELLGKGLGLRVPLGWELEFEAEQVAGWLGSCCYQQVGELHGLILTVDGESAVEGPAVRTHWWGLGGPVELHVGRGHRPVQTRVRLPSRRGIWQLAAGENGLRVSCS